MKQFRGIFLAILSSSTFGMIPFFALPVIQEGVGIDSILFYRFAVSAVIVGLYLLFVKSDFRITAKELVTLFFLGVFYMPLLLYALRRLICIFPAVLRPLCIFYIRYW